MSDRTADPRTETKEWRFIVAIGASAGGLTAIEELLAELPGNLNAPVVVASHSMPESKLRQALQFRSTLNIKRVEDGERLEHSTVYVVPGAKHAFFRNGCLYLSDVVEDSGFRPSIDALFMTMAAEYGDRAIAVVLSGLLEDGMRGAQIIHDMGGRTIVQHPDDAAHPSMPASIIRHDHPIAIRTASELGTWLHSEVGTTSRE